MSSSQLLLSLSYLLVCLLLQDLNVRFFVSKCCEASLCKLEFVFKFLSQPLDFRRVTLNLIFSLPNFPRSNCFLFTLESSYLIGSRVRLTIHLYLISNFSLNFLSFDCIVVRSFPSLLLADPKF